MISGGSELFGGATRLPDGSTAHDGFQALAAQDSNADGIVSAADANWQQLQVWVDANADGVSQAGELRSLEELSIKSLEIAASSTSEKQNGNWIGLRGSYETTDGASHEVADVWFLAERTSQLAAAITAFSETEEGPATAGSLGLPEPGASQAGMPSGIATGDVSRLVEAMRAFEAGSVLSAVSSALARPASGLQSQPPDLAETPNSGATLGSTPKPR